MQDAVQMGQTCHVVFVLDVLDHIEGLVTDSAAGAVGAGDKIRLERCEFRNGAREVFQPMLRFGREELERIGSLSLLKNFFDFCHKEHGSNADQLCGFNADLYIERLPCASIM